MKNYKYVIEKFADDYRSEILSSVGMLNLDNRKNFNVIDHMIKKDFLNNLVFDIDFVLI